MAESINFTQTRLEKLSPAPKGKRISYEDAKKPKLILRVTDKGTKTFCVVKKTAGKTKWVTIGKWPETSIDRARKDVDGILNDLNAGVDPTEKKRSKKIKSTTLGELLEQYLSERDLKDTTKKDYRIKFKRGFDGWKNIPASQITEQMVMKRQQEISKSGKTTSNNTMRVLRLLMRYGKAIQAIEDDPTVILKSARLWHKNKRKTNIIPSDSLKDWYQAVRSLPSIKNATYLLILLHTGLRHTEGLSLLWKDINWQESTLLVRETKNHLDHTLPIPSVLIAQLQLLERETGHTPWLFPNTNETSPLSEASRTAILNVRNKSVYFSAHDLRRTFATIAEAVYLPQTIIKRLLNHVTDNDITGGYIQTEMDTLREAINKIASYITTRVSASNNVIPITSKKS